MFEGKKKYRDSCEYIESHLFDINTPIGKAIEALMLFLNFSVCLIFVIETYPISAQLFSILNGMEIFIVIIFSLEYILRFYAAKNKARFVLNIFSIIDLASILPIFILLMLGSAPANYSMIMIIRILKIFRIFRFLRYIHTPVFFFGSVSPHLLKVFRLILTIFIIFFIGSGFFWMSEYKFNYEINSFGDAFYFTVVTLTTVGFGDIVPLTVGGRWVTVLMIISGIILIPWQASQIVREWFFLSHKKNIICPQCGLKYHDRDAIHCKSCGSIIYQEFDGY
jgi:voltage-gated potassium channel